MSFQTTVDSAEAYETKKLIHGEGQRELYSLNQDLRIIRFIRTRLQRACNFDPSRIFATLSVCDEGIPKLSGTLRSLITQADEIGVGLDVALGLNDGAVVPGAIRTMLSTHGRIKDLLCGPQAEDEFGNALPVDLRGERYLFDDADLNEGHRFILAHQGREYGARGKNHMLRILYDAAMDSMLNGTWSHPPEWTLQLDDESRLFDGVKLSSNGLRLLIVEARERALSAIGARWRNAPFTGHTLSIHAGRRHSWEDGSDECGHLAHRSSVSRINERRSSSHVVRR
jgi:hypothetical protein